MNLLKFQWRKWWTIRFEASFIFRQTALSDYCNWKGSQGKSFFYGGHQRNGEQRKTPFKIIQTYSKNMGKSDVSIPCGDSTHCKLSVGLWGMVPGGSADTCANVLATGVGALTWRNCMAVEYSMCLNDELQTRTGDGGRVKKWKKQHYTAIME